MHTTPSPGPVGMLRYAKGNIIVNENDTTNSNLYFLLQGNAVAYHNFRKPGQTHAKLFAPGSYFNEMALFLGKPLPFTVVAQSDIIALSVNRQNVTEIFTAQPTIAVKIMEAMCKQMYDLLNPGSTAEEPLSTNLNPNAETATDPAARTIAQTPSQASSLFPEGHGSYLLPLKNENTEYLYQKDCTCPLCGHSFKHVTVLTSRLKLEHTDPDARNRYKDIEPIHYDVVSCPSCAYSALDDLFPTVSKGLSGSVNRALSPYLAGIALKTGLERDTFTVFAGYYLALLCAPICFDDHQNITARLWLKLCRIYQDCEDAVPYSYALEHCLAEYRYCYECFGLAPKRMQQVTYTIGDLYMKLGDIDNAQQFFFISKSVRNGASVMQRQAENRFEDIRELKKRRAQEQRDKT